ncbi:uncharacterized protein YdhG (YjbR/CyaY superfamily) [Labrenzia sp. EL_159]|nr:uncharacterized protein YdhG (YjbR/CyaY superfamily) [Labrenzia sp. EL_162]MBG6194745.1 uncharacterized protein YdhG (YjbR/CyaY superfamily) [Labrenzia sp. EL_159]
MTEKHPTLDVIETYPDPVRNRLMQLRGLILETALKSEHVGEVQETLKWGQPSFLTVKPKTGTTIRIDKDTSDLGDVALYVNCQTSLVSDWRALYPHIEFGGNRSVHFKAEDPLPENEICQMISMALTYHVKKR